MKDADGSTKKRKKNELPLLSKAEKGEVGHAPKVSGDKPQEYKSNSRGFFDAMDTLPLGPADMEIAEEIYDFNFHLQPRILQGVLSKGYYSAETFVLKLGKIVLSVITVKKHTVPEYSFLEILLCASNIYFRNCGSASVLTSVMVEKARREGCKFLLAWSAYPARNFWLRCGFHIHEPTTVELKYFRKNSLVFDRSLLMILDINTWDDKGKDIQQTLRKYAVTELRDTVNDQVWPGISG